jgi:hypothetical protein
MRYVKLQRMLLEIMCTSVECNYLLCLFYVNLYLCDPYSDFSESVEKNIISSDSTVCLFILHMNGHMHA